MSPKKENGMSRRETLKDRFKRVAVKRTRRVLKELELLSNCGNKHDYSYSEKDVENIFEAISQQLKETRNKFGVKRSGIFDL